MKRSTRRRTCLAAGLVVALSTAAAGVSSAEDTVSGYRYQLHNARPSANAFDNDPSAFKHAATLWVEQGPHHTLIWGSADHHTLNSASFARGRMRMGLFTPHWDFSRPASDAEGWTSYGRPLEYKSFSVDVTPGGKDRKIDGEQAAHYVLKADFSNRQKGGSAYDHVTISSDLWVLKDKPFSWATYATPGIYGDPRLDAAMTEKLSKLGLVVRAETTYERYPESPAGKKLDDARKGTYLSWLTGIHAANVPDPYLPTVSYQTTRELQHATWKDADGTCHKVTSGGTPEFVKDMLNPEQRASFLHYLGAACERRAKRKHKG